MAVQVSDFDRFSFTLFMALALHAVVVLGITFAPEDPQASAETLEITLSRFSDEEAPEDADFLAQSDQQGSGTEEEKQELTSPERSEFSDPEVEPVQPEPRTTTEPVPAQAQQVITSEQGERSVSQPQKQERAIDEPLPLAEKKSLMERSLEIASLEARYDQQRQAYAKRPRVTRVTAASTMRSVNAAYVQNWVSRVTRVGNLNYPSEARQSGIHGTLRMLVSLRKDGTLKEVSILESSGNRILDDAAIRIVRQSAPFPPFPDDMRENTDELEIIRTWSFQRRGLSSG